MSCELGGHLNLGVRVKTGVSLYSTVQQTLWISYPLTVGASGSASANCSRMLYANKVSLSYFILRRLAKVDSRRSE